jgi:hypothetical protein
MWSNLEVTLLTSLVGTIACLLGAMIASTVDQRSLRNGLREATKAGVLICDGEGYLLIKQNKPRDLPTSGEQK